MGIFSKRWQQSGAINNSYKLLKSEKKKIGRMKMQTDDATDSMRDLRTHTNDNSGLRKFSVVVTGSSFQIISCVYKICWDVFCLFAIFKITIAKYKAIN